MLDFQGPYHFDQRINYTDDLKNKGIYIWGFAYYVNGKQLGTLVEGSQDFNQNTMKFIPHYVGLADRFTLLTRIEQHHDIIAGDRLKYKRLSLDYMRAFFCDPDFPLHFNIRGIHNRYLAFIAATQHYRPIEYYNRPNVLRAIYPGPLLHLTQVGDGWPINAQTYNDLPLPDTLSDYIVRDKNFWFCYAIPSVNRNMTDYPLEYLEAYTFWSLKGKTISTVSCSYPPAHDVNINFGPTVAYLFGNPNKVWLGYDHE